MRLAWVRKCVLEIIAFDTRIWDFEIFCDMSATASCLERNMIEFELRWITSISPSVCSHWASKDAGTARFSLPPHGRFEQIWCKLRLPSTSIQPGDLRNQKNMNDYMLLLLRIVLIVRCFSFSPAIFDCFAQEWGGRQRGHGHFETFQPQMVSVATRHWSSLYDCRDTAKIIKNPFSVSDQQGKKIRTPQTRVFIRLAG